VSAPLSPYMTHVADQVLAALGGPDSIPLSTPAVQDLTGYGPRYGQLVYRALTELVAAGQVEKLNAGRKPVFWRRLTAMTEMPVITLTRPGDERGQS
jgi:hypothetical protein